MILKLMILWSLSWNIVDKSTKLSNIDSSIDFTVDFSQFFSKTVKLCLSGAGCVLSYQFQAVHGVSLKILIS